MGTVGAMPPRKRSSADDADAAGGKPPSTRKRATSKSTRSRKATEPPEPLPEETEPPPRPPAPAGDTFGRWSQSQPTDTADLASYYGRLIDVSSKRVGLLGDLLAEDYETRQLDALRRITYTATEDGGAEPSGEIPTALVRLEMEERRTLERLLVKAAEIGIDMRNVAMREKAAAEKVALLIAFAERLGLDQQDPNVRRTMQMAVLDVRRSIGT